MKKLLDFNEDGQIDIKDLKVVLFRYEWIVISGLLLMVFPLGNVLGLTNINSDFFWVLAGVCLTVEGIVELYYEKKHWVKMSEDK